MKIKYITDVRVPTSRAVGYAVMKMCEQFAANGSMVNLLTPNRSDSDSLGDPFDYYDIEKKFTINKVWSTDLLGLSMILGRIFYWIDLLSFLFSLRFSKLVDEKDVVYTRDYLISLILPKKQFVCLELHDVPKGKFFFKKSLNKLDVIFALNIYVKNELASLGVDESIIHIVPSGVDVKSFDIQITKNEAREKLNLPKDRKIIVYTGHLYKWKGVDTLAGVARILRDYIFVFIGGVEPDISIFKEKNKDLDNLTVVPFLSRSMIPVYLKAGDVLVVPNSKETDISSRYTSPLKLLEYMASLRPIVASDLPSLREILSESNCVFAEPDNVQSFSKSIQKVLTDTNLSDSISKNAKSSIYDYDWSVRAKKIIDIIESHKKK